jgi:hypothetical protein
MSPSFSTKNGVRYRFYVSSALLRGRKTEVGSVGRVPATEIESAVFVALQPYRGKAPSENGSDPIRMVERVVVARNQLSISLTHSDADDVDGVKEIRIPWSTNPTASIATVESDDEHVGAHNESLIQSVVRAHAWKQSLLDGIHESVEKLAQANGLHPKVVRQALRMAFLSPDITSAILEGRQPAVLSLAQIPKLLPLSWTNQGSLLR